MITAKEAREKTSQLYKDSTLIAMEGIIRNCMKHNRYYFTWECPMTKELIWLLENCGYSIEKIERGNKLKNKLKKWLFNKQPVVMYKISWE